jgi:hypothetical protein
MPALAGRKDNGAGARASREVGASTREASPRLSRLHRVGLPGPYPAARERSLARAVAAARRKF